LQPPTAGNVDYCWTLAEVKVEVDEETGAEENSTHVASTEEQRLVGLKLRLNHTNLFIQTAVYFICCKTCLTQSDESEAGSKYLETRVTSP